MRKQESDGKARRELCIYVARNAIQSVPFKPIQLAGREVLGVVAERCGVARRLREVGEPRGGQRCVSVAVVTTSEV